MLTLQLTPEELGMLLQVCDNVAVKGRKDAKLWAAFIVKIEALNDASSGGIPKHD